jgi:hypothetical protein
MRQDLALMNEWDRRYAEEVLKPVLESMREAIDSRIPKFSPELKKKIRAIAQEYGLKLEGLFDDILPKTEVSARRAYLKELEKQVPTQFRVERGSNIYSIFSGAVYQRVGSQWVQFLDFNQPATVSWLKYAAEDGLTLSDRIWRDAANFQRTMENTIARNIQLGKSARSLGKQFLEFADQQPVKLSKEMQKFIQDLAPEDAQRAIQQYIKKKLDYNATRVARTEIQRAYRTSYLDQAKKLPFVKGVKWNRSRTEYYCAICENLATADLYGLGPGVYPADKAPKIPHPHCRCFYSTILMPLRAVKS